MQILFKNSSPSKSCAVLQTASIIRVAILGRLPQKQIPVLMRSSVNSHAWLNITCFYLRRKRTCMVKTGTALDYNTEIWSQGKRELALATTLWPRWPQTPNLNHHAQDGIALSLVARMILPYLPAICHYIVQNICGIKRLWAE